MIEKSSLNMDIPSNSGKAKYNADRKAGEKQVKQIVTAKTRKKPFATKMAEAFIEDDISNVKSYVLMDVLLPSIKNALADMITGATEMILFGGAGSRPKNRSGNTTYVSYNKYSGNSTSNNKQKTTDRTGRHAVQEIIFNTRQEANEVIDMLAEIVSTYGSVSIGDLYDAVGITGEFTDQKYGWVDAREFDVRRVREGYLLVTPKPQLLD